MKRLELLRRVIMLSALVPISIFAGCGDDSSPDPEQKEDPASITITSEETTLVFIPGETMRQTLSFKSTKAWELSEIKADWLRVTPLSGEAGTAVLTIEVLQEEPRQKNEIGITIISEDAKAVFSVIQHAALFVDGVNITDAPGMIFHEEETSLQITISPEGVTPKSIEWESSDDTIISVDGEGNIRGVELGTATITVTVDGFSDQCTIEVAEFGTGEGNRFTFPRLSRIPASGVTVEENGEFVLNQDLAITANNTLVLQDNEVVRWKDGTEIKVEGTLEFTPDENARATMTRYDEAAKPKRLYLTGDYSGGEIRNVVFNDVPVRMFGSQPLTIDNCEFKNITTNLAAIDMGGTSSVTVTNSRFVENNYPAIAGASNATIALTCKGNYMERNVLYDGNRPTINVTVAGNGLVDISDNEIIGLAQVTKSGGIAVSNLIGIPGTNKVVIKNNKVRDCRYGITTNGLMDVQIIGNELKDNKHESNPMNGGSGISIYNSNGGQKVFISENTITGNLWGITIIGSTANGKGPAVNMGYNVSGADFNIGRNVLRDNGNNGQLYDLYNNSPLDMNAMNNTWGSVNQTETEIEKVIFHKPDDTALGKVTFMPAYSPGR